MRTSADLFLSRFTRGERERESFSKDEFCGRTRDTGCVRIFPEVVVRGGVVVQLLVDSAIYYTYTGRRTYRVPPRVSGEKKNVLKSVFHDALIRTRDCRALPRGGRSERKGESKHTREFRGAEFIFEPSCTEGKDRRVLRIARRTWEVRTSKLVEILNGGKSISGIIFG